MSLRTRLTMLTAMAVGVTVVVAAVIAYFLVDSRLRGDLDDSLRGTATSLAALPVPEAALPFFRIPNPGPTFYAQVVQKDGRVQEPEGQQVHLPVPRETQLVAARTDHETVMADATVDGQHLRVATAPGRGGRSVQLARSLGDLESTMDQLRTALLIVGGLGVLVSAGLGLVLGRAILRPVARLTVAAERVASTEDLSAAIDVRRKDELGRLAASINRMLAALDASRKQQRRLVTDASHELRTPLTSLRTNAELLTHNPAMSEAERNQIVADMTAQTEEVTTLMDDLIELSHDATAPHEAIVELDADAIVTSAVERVRARAPQVSIDILELEPTRVRGNPQALERALVNVLDNACKWSPDGGRVEVRLANGTVTVRDHGPGIDGTDLPHVFDRFYRSPAARSSPGSGLGLAIVRQVIDDHGGAVDLEPTPGGGTTAKISLPASR